MKFSLSLRTLVSTVIHLQHFQSRDHDCVVVGPLDHTDHLDPVHSHREKPNWECVKEGSSQLCLCNGAEGSWQEMRRLVLWES